MIGRLRTLSCLGLLALAAAGLGAQQESDEPVVLERSIGELEVDGRRSPIGYARTPSGPLFTLHPIVARLGGDLELGPLGDSHRLVLGGTSYVFGPGSRAVTVGDEILDLSQAPQRSTEGLEVPLDLLRALYTESTGYDFSWSASERRLTVARRAGRELTLGIDAVDLQGVTTLVLRFSAEPRYRLAEDGRTVRVQLLGDTIAPGAQVPDAPRVRQLAVDSREIVLRIADGSGFDHYTLAAPFRIVFELFPQDTAVAAETPPLPSRRDGPPTIVIDPGHGGGETGAIGPAGVQEKTLTLRLARLLAESLRRRLPVRVLLTRDEDAELPLATRAALANQIRADLFLSIHLNSSHGSTAHGAETYFLSLEASDERAAEAAESANAAGGGDAMSDLQLILWDMAQTRHLASSQRLANLIQEELNQALGLRDRGVKQAPFTVLMGVDMPAVLVELGFISNPREEERLQDPAYQRQLIDALVRAVLRFRARESATPVAGAGRPR